MGESPPGDADPVHRHDAHGFIYVLESSIVMSVKGGKEVTLMPEQRFHEGPEDVHTVGRNASQDKPAKFFCVSAERCWQACGDSGGLTEINVDQR